MIVSTPESGSDSSADPTNELIRRFSILWPGHWKRKSPQGTVAYPEAFSSVDLDFGLSMNLDTNQVTGLMNASECNLDQVNWPLNIWPPMDEFGAVQP
jgi:hypothetical protein